MKKFRIEIKWAFIFWIMAIFWMLLERLAGLHSVHIDKHPIFTNLFAIPAITVYVLAMYNKRKRHYSGRMTYLQGLATGMVITLVFTILNPLSQYLISTVITPDFFGNAIEYAVSSGRMTKDEALGYFNLHNYIKQGYIGAPVMGAITSAIVAFFFKQGKSETTGN